MGDHLGILGAVCVLPIPKEVCACLMYNVVVIPSSIVYDHIALSAPVLVRSPKLSNVEPSQYWMGDHLGILGAVCVLPIPKEVRAWLMYNVVVIPSSSVYDHITLSAPVLVRSTKLSDVEPSQHLDTWMGDHLGILGAVCNFPKRSS